VRYHAQGTANLLGQSQGYWPEKFVVCDFTGSAARWGFGPGVILRRRADIVEREPLRHGLYSAASRRHAFTEVGPNLFSGAVSTVVTGINNNNQICGFWTDKNGNSQSFFGPFGGKLKSFRFIFNGKPVAVTQAFGCNDNSKIVGTFTDSAGHVHGFLTAFNGVNFIDFDVFDAPGSQQKLAFGVQGTHQWGKRCGRSRRIFFRWHQSSRLRVFRPTCQSRVTIEAPLWWGRLA
jgi:probable HAF family extracellular repeat protein